MSPTDPFSTFESERTIIKPRPRQPVAPPSSSQDSPASPPITLGPLSVDEPELSLLNPLVSAARPLLMLIGRLRQLINPPDGQVLRQSAAKSIENFDSSARKAGIDSDTIIAARYVLCTAVDEAATNTPWGLASSWNKHSLLVQFHNETRGGEKVFQLLARLSQDPPNHLGLLELIYCVLALGFQGRYQVLENGLAQLDALRARLAELIRKNRPASEMELSPHWRVQIKPAQTLKTTVPIWLLGTMVALLLAMTWFGLRLWLNYRSDAVFGQIAALHAPAAPPQPVAVTPPVPAVVPPARLARFLEPEIKAGLVTVTDESDRSTVRLLDDRFFSSGSADPIAQSLPVLQRIATALSEVSGQVLITGHTDNIPIRSLRYPSNWNLSNARAQAVLKQLAIKVDPTRMHSQGKADAQPIAPNDTPANRARNRRVEITLLTGGA